jgi:hypothetical protein
MYRREQVLGIIRLSRVRRIVAIQCCFMWNRRQPVSVVTTECLFKTCVFTILRTSLPWHLFIADTSLSRYSDWLLVGWWSGFDFGWGLGIFLFDCVSRPALGPTLPPIQWVPWALSLGVKWLRREADHSPPSSAEVKKCVELYLHSPNTSSWRGA